MSGAFDGLSDEELVARFLASERRDDAAFAELFRRRRADVWGACRRFFGNPRDAEDLTQEIFFTAFRKLPQFRGQSSLRTWLYRIASNTCKNELRRRSRRTEASETELDSSERELVTGDTPEDRVARGRLQGRLALALSKLDADERRLLLQVEFEARPYGDIAADLRVSVGAVKMRVLRARLALQAVYKELESRGVVP